MSWHSGQTPWLKARGLLCWPTQLVQRFSTQDTQHWRTLWGSGPGLFEWTAGDLIYHEAAAVVAPDRSIKIWDPTHNWWIPPEQVDGYGATLLARVSVTDQEHAGSALHWGRHRLRPNIWEEIAIPRGQRTAPIAHADRERRAEQRNAACLSSAGRRVSKPCPA